MLEPEKKIYNRWRLRILLSIIGGYGTYYLCRQNFNILMPSIMDEFGYTKSDFGLVLSAASIIYGIGKFFNGYISDQSNARYFMSFGLFASAITTFFMGFSEGILFLGGLYCLNNWFQSMGWPPAARMLTHWYAQAELGRKWALGAASHQIGGGITLVFTGYLVTNYGWRYGFFIPASIAIIVSFILFNRLRESPKSVNLPSVEIYKSQTKDNYDHVEEDRMGAREIFQNVFLNKKIWFIGFANMFIYIVRMGIIFWIPLFLKEVKGMSLSEAGIHVAGYEIIGLLGGYTAGYISDKFFNGQRAIVGAAFMLGLAINLFLFWNVSSDNSSLAPMMLVLVGFFVYGPQVLIGVASADFSSKKAVGTANGFVGSMAYLGSSLSGFCIGHILDNYGWDEAFIFFISAAILGAFMFILTMENRKN